METEIQYIVTKGTKYGTIRTGDHIKLEKNGDLLCHEGGGWIPKKQVKSVMKGIQYQKDLDFYKKKIAKHQKIIYDLEKQLNKGDKEDG